MKKNRAVVMVLAIVLVAALVCGLCVGCKSSDENVNINNGGNSSKGSTKTISDADTFMSFLLSSTEDVEDVSSYVTVKNLLDGQSVDVSVGKLGKQSFKVYPPNGGYVLGDTYKIEIDGSRLAFASYPEVTTIKFTVTSDVVNKVVFNNGVVQYDSSLKAHQFEEVVGEDGSIHGSMNFQSNGVQFSAGDVFVVNNADKNIKEAYKVTEAAPLGDSLVGISYVKPNLDEVYSEFDYKDSEKLDNDSDVDWTYNEETTKALENSELAGDIVSIFASAPTFDVKVNLNDGVVHAEVTITVPDVVKVEGAGTSDLVITVSNDLSAKAESEIFLNGDGVNFDVSADIFNDITCRVTLGTSGSGSYTENMQEIVDKLLELTAKEEGDPISVPLFKWVLPIADGAASISYDADLVFRFAFSGTFDVDARASIDYSLGASYNLADGVNAYASTPKASMDSLGITLDGEAEIKVGIIQGLDFDILAGVLGVGINAELGNYNRLYGYATTTNLVADEPDLMGGVYFEGGFYYDVDLTYGIKLGSLVNLNGKADIAAGEIKLYDAGNREVVLAIEPIADFKIAALNSKLPNFQIKVYDMVTGETFFKDADPALVRLDFTDATYFDNDGLNVRIKEGKGSEPFTEYVTVGYGDLVNTFDLKLNYEGGLVLETNFTDFDKSAKKDVVIAYRTTGEDTPVVYYGDTVVEDAIVTADSITIPQRRVGKLGNGECTFTLKSADFAADLRVAVSGSVGLYAYKSGDAFEIFSADQLQEMSKLSSVEDFAGKIFFLSSDVDMGGAKITPIKEFAGAFNGNGHKVADYAIDSFVDKSAGFFAENIGRITDTVFEGSVAIVTEGGTGKDYNVGGVVGKNLGVLEGVTFKGTVSVDSTGLASFIDFNVGALTGANDGTIETSGLAEGTKVSVTSKFDLLNVNFNVGGISATEAGSNVEISTACTMGAGGGKFVKFNIAK